MIDAHFRRSAPSSARTAPRVVLAEPDPYLALLVRLEVPAATVVEGGDPSGADLIVVNLDGPHADELLAGRGSSRVLGIADPDTRRRVRDTCDAVVPRPFGADDFQHAVRTALGLAQRKPAVPATVSVGRWVRLGRLGMLVIAGWSDIGGGAGRWRLGLFAALVCYTAIRSAMPVSRLRSWTDVVAATLTMLVTGGLGSPYLGWALMASLEGGMDVGLPFGTVSGAIIAAGCLPGASAAIARGSAHAGELASSLALLPLTGVVGVLISRIAPKEWSERARALGDANTTLVKLHGLARALPGGFDAKAIAAAAMDEVRETMGARAAMLLAGRSGALVPLASFGVPEGIVVGSSPAARRLIHGGARTVTRAQMPAPFSGLLHERWVIAPIHAQGVGLGTLLAACPDPDDRQRLLLQHLADEVGIRLENARLFSRLQQLSLDEERRRLARELHDGVIQPLAHVHLELGFVARHGTPESFTTETERLARVIERAIGDVRSAVHDLRAELPEDGLVASLGSYVRDLRSAGGPEIELRTSRRIDAPPAVEREMFRVVQEALSNAMRHARASRITVDVDGTPSSLRIVVADDGVGLRCDGDGEGVGLHAMRERADRIGAHLSITSEDGRGVRVEVEWREL